MGERAKGESSKLARRLLLANHPAALPTSLPPDLQAHMIKNPRAKASRAAANLTAERHWAMTGKPSRPCSLVQAGATP